jgi:hypothetical protein
MPAKIQMVLNNGNMMPPQMRSINQSNLTSAPSILPKTSNALNSSIIGRIHSVKPGCGGCGRH